MNDIPPMRSVDHIDTDTPRPQRNWVVGLWFLAIVSGGVALALAPPSTGLAIVSALVVCVGLGLAAAGTVRTHRENRGQRLPWWGRPPVQPRRWDLLTGSGTPMVVFGAAVFGRSVGGPVTSILLPLTVGGVLAVVVTAAQALHNRRVAVG